MELILHRDLPTIDCTVGTLAVNGRSFHTIERPWVPNEYGGLAGAKYESCVAPGRYRLRPWERPSGEKCWILSNPALDVYELPQNVPKGRERATRTLVLIHAGNYVRDVIGCIAPGKGRNHNSGEWMVISSRDAMNELRTLIGGRLDLELLITGGVDVGTLNAGG